MFDKIMKKWSFPALVRWNHIENFEKHIFFLKLRVSAKMVKIFNYQSTNRPIMALTGQPRGRGSMPWSYLPSLGPSIIAHARAAKVKYTQTALPIRLIITYLSFSNKGVEIWVISFLGVIQSNGLRNENTLNYVFLVFFFLFFKVTKCKLLSLCKIQCLIGFVTQW